ncbi:MAG: hypothetical protein FWG55_04715 [Candidatus Bathyarchaeota archaeon]|nr:hypothetical protein [Candidatus Termiticorpusculum sp.]
MDQKSIEVTIKNQPFTPYIGENNTWMYGPNGQEFNLYYVVHFKGHFGEDWQDFADPYNGYYYGYFTVQSNSEYTVVSRTAKLPAADSQLDFRVKAVIGYNFNDSHDSPLVPPQWHIHQTAEQSDWSSVHAFTVPDSSSAPASPTQTATLPTPSVTSGDNQPQPPDQTQPPDFMFTNPLFMLGVGALFGGVVVVVVMVVLRRRIKTSTYTNDSFYETSGVNGLYA